MYNLKEKKGFIVIDGSDIIDSREVLEICSQLEKLLSSAQTANLLVDFRELDLYQSKFDGVINYLARFEIEKIALVLDQPVAKFKFKLWRRKYRTQFTIEQFTGLEAAQNWLLTA